MTDSILVCERYPNQPFIIAISDEKIFGLRGIYIYKHIEYQHRLVYYKFAGEKTWRYVEYIIPSSDTKEEKLHAANLEGKA